MSAAPASVRRRVRAVALPNAAAGFRLAGLQVDEEPSPRLAAQRAVALAARDDVGVLLVEQAAVDALPDPERVALLDRPAPIVVPFPGPTWDVRGPAADVVVLDILRRAIGYRVRLG